MPAPFPAPRIAPESFSGAGWLNWPSKNCSHRNLGRCNLRTALAESPTPAESQQTWLRFGRSFFFPMIARLLAEPSFSEAVKEQRKVETVEDFKLRIAAIIGDKSEEIPLRRTNPLLVRPKKRPTNRKTKR